MLKDGLPGALVTALILGIHEIGHIIVAKEAGIKMGVPYFVPSWQVRDYDFHLYFIEKTALFYILQRINCTK